MPVLIPGSTMSGLTWKYFSQRGSDVQHRRDNAGDDDIADGPGADLRRFIETVDEHPVFVHRVVGNGPDPPALHEFIPVKYPHNGVRVSHVNDQKHG
jgi:hypothetical protein